MMTCRLLAQFSKRSLYSGNLVERVLLLLAFQSNDLRFRILHEALVAKLLTHTDKEALEVLQLSFELLYFSIHIDKVAQWHSIL